MTRTSCLCTAKYIFFNIYLRRNQILLIFFRHFVELPAKSQPLLNYFWDISRDWEAARNDNSALEIVAKLENWRQVKYVKKYGNLSRLYFLTHHAGILLSQPGEGILHPHPLLRLCQCYPTLQSFSSINFHKLPLYLE